MRRILSEPPRFYFNQITFALNDWIQCFKNWQKGYGFFPDSHIWDLKNVLPIFLVPRLKAFQSKILTTEYQALPNWMLTQDEIESGNTELVSEEILKHRWHETIGDMIFAFEHDTLSNKTHETFLERRQKGFQLFVKYYDHLWD